MKKNIHYLSINKPYNMDNSWFLISSAEHFWIRYRFEFFKKYCPEFIYDCKNALEIGCGSGLFLNQISKMIQAKVDGCDTNQQALEMISGETGNIYYYDIHDTHPSIVESYDAIFLMDVLEHIENDVEFLKSSIKHLRPNGLIIINVPAIPFLFSSYDKVQGHQRRYTTQSLTDILQACDIEILKLQPWGISMIPVLFIRKLLLKVCSENKSMVYGFRSKYWIENMLSWLYQLEYKLLPKSFIGTSILAFGKIKDV